MASRASITSGLQTLVVYLRNITAGSGTATGSPAITLLTSSHVASNVNLALTDLITYTLPGGTLAHDGDCIEIIGEVTYAANADTKTVVLIFGGTTLAGRGPAADNGSLISMRCRLIRTGATAQLAEGLTAISTTAGQLVTFTAPAETLANDIVIKISGQSGTGSNDVTSRLLIVRYYPVGTYAT